jgi:hypothetical protein
MPLEIIEKARPIREQPMNLEVAQREREAVVDAHQRGHILGKPLDQPFCDPAPRPVFLGGR